MITVSSIPLLNGIPTLIVSLQTFFKCISIIEICKIEDLKSHISGGVLIPCVARYGFEVIPI